MMILLKFIKFLITFSVYCNNLTKASTSASLSPCTLDKSIELNLNQKQSDNSYLVDGIIIPKNLTFSIRDVATNTTTIRGCICSIKTCLPWCCSYLNQTMKDLKCTEQNQAENIDDLNITIVKKDESIVENINFMEYFYMQRNRNLKCESELSYVLNGLEFEEDNWETHENGSLRLMVNIDRTKVYLPQNEFCFALFKNEITNSNTIGPHICRDKVTLRMRDLIYGISLLLSQPFMIITIIVYLAVSKLRNLHGKALVCYLSSLSISYFCLAYILLTTNHEEHFTACTVIGYICYVTIMSAYLWLSAISFDLWFNFSSYDKARASQNIRFIVYCFICYGIAIIYAIAAYVVQNSTASEAVKPGIGYKYCYLNVEEGYSAVIWLYQPLICVITFNILMFVLTWRKIKSVTLELSRIMDKTNSKRNLKNERNEEIFFRFSIFLRLFVIMGVSWTAEIVSYFAANDWQAIFFVTDLLNAMQGLLIFLLFVFKKLLKRFHQIRATSNVMWTKESGTDKSDDKSGAELTKSSTDSTKK